ncbi:hypothetical protein TOPH_02866 [Tolypocladium ophioglossoides CBS 100239]|uniref:Uncharacterized protein n=1 Tax=Tolypocladium ophioglossoides (strain CBS 100239) TaxID=1163406 RepID=A0A0L0NF92_TOLOC|nr:hypothetical protein TOPH_02866 [Tolypocladium ophioglossoides CBS 100239]
MGLTAASGLVNRNGPGGAAASLAESIVKPADGKARQLKAGGMETRTAED